MRLYLLTIIAFLAASCQSTNSNSVVVIQPEVVAPIADTEPVETKADEPIQTRFCNDDIYTQHVRSEFSKQKTGRDSARYADEESFKALRYQLPLEFAGSPIQPSPRVLAWISNFTGGGRGQFLLWLVRSASFRDTVLPALEKEGLPEEFLFLAMIESGFSNNALSHAKAAGTWQFMKPTAERYGLQVNYFVDERRDPIKSTLAAARYLKDLHNQFGDWYLALAAYNAGPGKVMKAMKAMKSRDYWVLAKSPYLRTETKDYVPKLLAALIVASHASTYGFDVVADVRAKAPTAKIQLYNAYRLEDIASRLGVPTGDLQRWNPELMQTFTPPINPIRRKSYSLHVPRGLDARWVAAEPELERLTISDILIHRIKRGDTLASIARRYKVSVKKILETNPSVNVKRLKLGQSLNVPVPSVQSGNTQTVAT